MPPVGHQRSAKNCRVQIEGTNMRMASFEEGMETEDLDTVNFESAGYDQGTVGIFKLPWSVRGPWDAAQNAYDDPPGLYCRDDLGQVTTYLSTTDNVFWSIPQSRVLSSQTSAEVKGLVNFAASCKANGQGWTRPTGSF